MVWLIICVTKLIQDTSSKEMVTFMPKQNSSLLYSRDMWTLSKTVTETHITKVKQTIKIIPETVVQEVSYFLCHYNHKP